MPPTAPGNSHTSALSLQDSCIGKVYRGGLYTAIDIVNDMRQIARAALAKG